MEGPTPVSALIHAATMVTAGVYLIVRSSPLYDLAPGAQLGVVIVGAVTLLFGAIIGCAKDDIKKALAASTMSQIGYMVLAAGLGPAGYAFAILHLLTHGFFKAGLFLGAGVGDARDGRRGEHAPLRRPAHACRSRSPPSGSAIWRSSACRRSPGFFSKDAIIEAALGAGGAKGCRARRRRAAGRGHHRVLHDPRDADDVLRRRRGWEPSTAHPHEAPP